jgi:hypothetical protein
VESLRALLDDILEKVKSLPQGLDPNEAYDFLIATSPLVIIVFAAFAGLIGLTAWKKKRGFLFALVAALFLSFIVFPSGRSVIDRTLKLPLKDRPACLLAAVARGAVWQEENLSLARECRVPEGDKVAATRDRLDDGADGFLTGRLANDRWSALGRFPNPPAGWQARSVDTAGSWAIYIETAAAAYRLETCPSSNDADIPDNARTDKTGELFVQHFSQRADPAGFRQFVTPDTRRILFGGRAHIYKFLTLRGIVRGYLLPAAGAYGDCAVLTGPYRRAGSSYRLIAEPTKAHLDQLRDVAFRTSVVELSNNS